MTDEQTIIARTNEVIALARRLYPTYTAPSPAILFNIRGKSCGGMAVGYRALRYNLDWYRADPADYLGDTIPHEVAHIVAAATGLGAGHNAGWRRICITLGGSGSRVCKNEAVNNVASARRTNQFLYKTECGNAEVWVGPVHHSKLQRSARLGMDEARGYALRTRMATGSYRIVPSGFTGKWRQKA
jgi:predicted SprT family Zn-dependent metalloprotease